MKARTRCYASHCRTGQRFNSAAPSWFYVVWMHSLQLLCPPSATIRLIRVESSQSRCQWSSATWPSEAQHRQTILRQQTGKTTCFYSAIFPRLSDILFDLIITSGAHVEETRIVVRCLNPDCSVSSPFPPSAKYVRGCRSSQNRFSLPIRSSYPG